MEKMYQIFVSSTYLDLIDIRNIAYQSILDMGQVPVGYHDIAANSNIQETINPLIDNSEIFILIIGENYGSISPSGNSYVEEEYNFAVSKGKPILCFIRSDYKKNDNYTILVVKMIILSCKCLLLNCLANILFRYGIMQKILK